MSSKIDINHLARLSRLELTPEEKEKYAQQMGGVLEYAEKIGDFRSPEQSEGSLDFAQDDKEGIIWDDKNIESSSLVTMSTSEESFQPPRRSPKSATSEESASRIEIGIINGVQDVMREDEVRESLPREEALKNAPAQKDGFIQVKAVFDNND